MRLEHASSVDPNPAGMGEFSRLAGVFFEPGKTFADIAARPSFVLPLLLMMLAGLAASYTLGQKVGWERIIRHQAESSARIQQLDPAARENSIAMQVKVAGIISIAGP